MDSKKRTLVTILTLAGSLLLIFLVIKTKQLYFSESDAPAVYVLEDSESSQQKLTVPKLQIFQNEKIRSKKVKPFELENLADNESDPKSKDEVDTNQQILTHKYLIKVLSQQQNYLRRCYENHLRSNTTSTSKGTIVVEFMILPFGEIRDVEIKDSNFKDKTFENCIQTVFLRTQVKKFNGEKFLITFPLEFE